ncbi:glutathione S-transferase [Sphingomonas guangdongensis]|uniref:Glutathione S-transferase n=1 Tax=Sphingomonas guangdongensis TaxID=1141890 RepID=A0A285R230_9SPHN|nr:glutathione S-transferase C-terminal domain-containing protein [Sphingomonas guangdongensis]SOB88166.1 glutathione S-transferase [Sphingomonas guangdongensis]
MTPILHEHAASGNCYKIRLTAALAGVAIERREYDITAGETRTPAFLAQVNANGRIPVLQIGDRFLPESGAACAWIAAGTPLIPSDRFDHANMLRWMFWEQYNHEPNIATLRYWTTVVGLDRLSEAQLAQVAGKRAGGAAALALLEGHLVDRTWIIGGAVTLADLVLYPYTSRAGEGGFDLSPHPHLRRWLRQVEQLPGFIPFT